ncbi:MAG: prepilin-type N-terminal cleavage/methylation domain-containing protein [Candidatus Wildermuthbacteria bacterium]|nr:prepilin-type N-terminal cleavage/methylation domain-containing protein [Candidatus Wildermuthbacteria bacterium]
MKAFTLFEILIVLGILAILASLTLPMGLEFYRSQQLEASSQGIVQALRKVQFQAISQERDSSFGVYLAGHNYILFQGNSYASRDSGYDEVSDIPQILNVSGLAEAVFSKLEGIPNATGDIILASGGNTVKININAVGRINLE